MRVKCAVCRKDFVTYPSYQRRRPNGAKYCSRRCWSYSARHSEALRQDAKRQMRTWLKSPERFWDNVGKTDGCWLWKGVRFPTGYGLSSCHTYAHRMAWELTYGRIPAKLFVCHHCDNPPCVRPDHLFLGTAKDNTQDAVRKGRWDKHIRRGESHPGHLLTEKMVRQIMVWYGEGKRAKEIANLLAVRNISTVKMVYGGYSWNHITGLDKHNSKKQ